jgi:ketosteroid isomerase-like protein
MKFYAPDVFVFDLVPPRQYVGVAAYRKSWESIVSMETYNFAITDLSITTDGTLAYSHSTRHSRGIDANGRPYELTTRGTDAYRKIRGQWFITMVHVSVPVDPHTGYADFASHP